MRKFAVLLLLATALPPRPCRACSVPVFRYALDRWAADAYRIEAPGRSLRTGPAGADLRGDDGIRLNLVALPRADDAGGDAILRFPAEVGVDGDADVAWRGELTPAAWRHVTESPARDEIARRLLSGDSAVWVLVESGHREADEAVRTMLTEGIAAAERLPLPVIPPDDPSSQIGAGPELRVRFSLLSVPRDAGEEAFLIASLAGPDGLASLPEDEPFAALVFGRGRVLGAWSPHKLTPELIQQASGFLLGACSCEAKHLNPGWDLLMRVNWDAELERVAATRQGASDTTATAGPEVVVYEPASATASDGPFGRPPVVDGRMIAGLVAVVMATGMLGLFLWRRRS